MTHKEYKKTPINHLLDLGIAILSNGDQIAFDRNELCIYKLTTSGREVYGKTLSEINFVDAMMYKPTLEEWNKKMGLSK